MIIIGEKSKIGTLCFFDNDTGEKVGELNNIESFDLTSDTIEEGNDYEQTRRVLQGDYTITLGKNIDNSGELQKIFGMDLSNKPDAYDVQFVKYVQARKHRKKRINKKWLKRYGVKKVLVNGKGWKIKTCTDGTYEFVK